MERHHNLAFTLSTTHTSGAVRSAQSCLTPTPTSAGPRLSGPVRRCCSGGCSELWTNTSFQRSYLPARAANRSGDELQAPPLVVDSIVNYLPPPALKGNASPRWSPSDSPAPDRYYSDAGEEPGRWLGRSARTPATLRSRGSGSGLIGLQTARVTSAPGMGAIRTPRVILGVRRNH